MHSPFSRSPARALWVAVGALTLLSAPSTHAAAQQAPPLSQRDSSALVRDARESQKDFELFRQSRIPVERAPSGGACDQRIGRICIWFGGDQEADFPPEPVEVGLARRRLITEFAAAAEQVSDPWVAGLLVHYLAEEGRPSDAERVARRCGLKDTWWCSALLGYALHLREDFVGAEAAFREALAGMPSRDRDRWMASYTFGRDAERALGRLQAPERERQLNLFWMLSDPLFLVEGNDRLTDHFARWVEARNFEKAEHPQGMFWDDDMQETLVRYGRTLGYSRVHSPERTMGFGGFGGGLQDTRRVVGHHHPRSRGYLFPEEFLASPADIVPESWITAPREARTWYAPPYAPDFHALDTQVGGFWRGDEILVVGAYRPEPGGDDGPFSARTFTDRRPDGPIESGLFLVREDGAGAPVEVRGSESDAVFTLLAPPGRYVSSLEVWDEQGLRAWRARQGVRQVALAPGAVGVSDLLILEAGAPYPETLDEAVPHVRRGVRVAQGERFTVVWEVYGLGVQTPAQVTLGFTRGRPGFLSRVGEFLGVLEPDRPVEVTFEDTNLEDVQTAFRAVMLGLPDLAPGEYTLHLRVAIPGREPSVSSRPIVVVGG